MSSAVRNLLASWVPHQRWFLGEAFDAQPLACLRPAPDVQVHILRDGANGPIYHVPVTVRQFPLEVEPIGTCQVRPGELRYVYDAPNDPEYHRWLLNASHEASTPGTSTPGTPTELLVNVLSGEQSNTSVVVHTNPPLIVKVFRVLSPGPNPDVDVPARLARAGLTCIARPVGAFDLDWGAGPAHGAVVTEYILDAVDGWQWLLTEFSNPDKPAGLDKLADRRADVQMKLVELGRTTADLHAGLQTEYGRFPASSDQLRTELANRQERAVGAAAKHLGSLAAALKRTLDCLELTDLPDRQRIHGDLHLGQVLYSASRGWVVIDFEGEPLRTVAERVTPDYPERDIASMLRSFDYAAATLVRTGCAEHLAAENWSSQCVESYLTGYRERRTATNMNPLHEDLTAAYLLDRAVYEVVYETQSRPDWVDIPLGALRKQLLQ